MIKLAGAIAGATVLAAVAVPVGQSMTDYDGPVRWESTTVTIGPDLKDAAKQWGSMTYKVVPASEAQISTTTELFDSENVGGEANATFRDGNYLNRCVISLPKGTDKATNGVLTHELGHCLGLTHRSGTNASNMHWWAGDKMGGWSSTVTDSDRADLADLYSK